MGEESKSINSDELEKRAQDVLVLFLNKDTVNSDGWTTIQVVRNNLKSNLFALVAEMAGRRHFLLPVSKVSD